MSKRSRSPAAVQQDDVRIQEVLDMIAPSVIKFFTDYFICGNTFRSVWALREYPTATEERYPRGDPAYRQQIDFVCS